MLVIYRKFESRQGSTCGRGGKRLPRSWIRRASDLDFINLRFLQSDDAGMADQVSWAADPAPARR